MHSFRSRLKNLARASNNAPATQTINDDRGAVIVEFAAVAIILVVMIFGIIEGGLLFRAKLSLSNSTDEAVRSASIAGNESTADYRILQGIVRNSADGAASIERVIVFKADSPEANPPETCRDGISTTDQCNVYTAEDFDRPETDFGTCGSLDGNWCPTNRDITLGGDLIGIQVQGSYTPITAIAGAVGLDQQSILPFESRGSAR